MVIWFLFFVLLTSCSGGSFNEHIAESDAGDAGDAGNGDDDLVEVPAEHDAGDEADDDDDDLVEVPAEHDAGDEADDDDDDDLVEVPASAGGDSGTATAIDAGEVVDAGELDEPAPEPAPPAPLPWNCAETCRSDVDWCQADPARAEGCATVAECPAPECTEYDYQHPTFGRLTGYNCGCDGAIVWFGNGASFGPGARSGQGFPIDEFESWEPHLEALWSCCGP